MLSVLSIYISSLCGVMDAIRDAGEFYLGFELNDGARDKNRVK